MNHPFSRGLPDFVGNYPRPSLSLSPSSYQPQSSGYPQYDPPGSRHPPTPPPASPRISVSDFSIRSDPVRKITPPEKEITAEDKIHRRDEKPATVEYKTPYDKAYACVQHFKDWRKGSSAGYYRPEDHEEPQVIKMSMKDWAKLSSELSLGESEESYPRLSYNAFTETLIIQCMPSPVHQSIGSFIDDSFQKSRLNLSEDLQEQIMVVWEEDCHGFGGQWAGSGKRPDLAIKVLNANGIYEIKFVLEAGLSESYDQLKKDARLWLGGMRTVSMVAIVKFVEDPKYVCPVLKDEDPQELGIPLDPGAIYVEEVTFTGEYGPFIYRGLTWVGEISEAYMELWVRGANGEAEQRGDRVNLKQDAQAQLDMGEFLPPGYPPMITLDLNRFRRLLKRQIRQMAAERCRDMVKYYMKRMGDDLRDRDYRL